jgi:hypothetical protein
MIEISHRQARYLLREAEDKRLPDEQWAALQAHLERCPECSAYRAHITALEKDLRREMQARWSPVRGPVEDDLPHRVAAYWVQRPARRRRVLSTLLGVLGLIAVALLVWRYQVGRPARPAPLVVNQPPMPSPSPTPIHHFSGLVAFTTQQSGNSEIYLLNAAGDARADLTNLTSSPAQDTDPAWSPDGEWIAFLSTRTGKRELYAISVAGTRLTQMTNDPNIDWQGPLSWSWDGQRIALAGRRLDQQGTLWVYIASLMGGEPVSLPGTRGGAS